ncbi:hypothetical protein C8F01DRAFT_1138389 [Mycena amicta]|nr:hypothetical protein C8F01DRAFT_1138389 [Mycena amicta]
MVLPNETLLEILQELSDDEDIRSLRTVSLANRRLRNLARSFVFANFHFRAHGFRWHKEPDETFPTLFLPEEEELALHTERLAFWTLPTIAPLVRTIHVSHWRRNARDGPAGGCRFDDSADTHLLLHRLFERLDAFTGLRLLSGYYAPFTETALRNLVRISHSSPQLSLDLYNCPLDVSGGWHEAQLRVRSACFSGQSTPQWWLSVIDGRSLETLDMPRTTPNFDEIQPTDIPSMPNLHELSVTLGIEHLVADLELLATKCPNVRKFRLDTDFEDLSLIGGVHSAPSPFSALESYTGPLECLSFFLPSGRLKALSLDHPSLSVDAFAAAIENFNLRPTITAFTCGTSSRGLDISTLRRLLAPFPALENLEMRLQVPHDSEDDWIAWTEAFHLYANLAADSPAPVFPPRLSEIQLLLTREFGLQHLVNVEPPTVHAVDKRALRASMLRLYPRLKKMVIVVPTFVVDWEDGRREFWNA